MDIFPHFIKRANATAINAAGQAGVLSGTDPTEVNPNNPITLFCIQLFIIICFTQGLGWLFKYIRQPRVIAEVVGGIILGPTVMGRIPHFTEHIFPAASLTYLSLISTIGLVLFLFLVGLEVDLSIIKKDWKSAVSISTAGMIIPFGAGCGIAVAIYREFIDSSRVEFGIFLLFVGVAAAITAFPVLCRILTETKLLETRVGQIVLSAGVGNDVVGWILLALTIALVNASSGVTAVYILLCAVGWTLFVLIPVKRAYAYLVRRSGSFDHAGGPTPGVMVVTFLLIFVSAFMTDIIGVHAIFGGFLAGLVIPHEHGFARKVTEKIDDLVTLLFLPIYFVLSGLKTNLGLLNDGKAWGYTFAIIFVAFFGKFIGCAGAAKLNKFDNRESLAIGMLMSCKGLVELIVLNVGLAAGILDTKVFSMFVFMAVVLTVITTPLTLWVYPARFHQRVRFTSGQQGQQDGKAGDDHMEDGSRRFAGGEDVPGGVRTYTSRIMVVLQKMEHLAAIMFLTQLFELPPTSYNTATLDGGRRVQAPPVLTLPTLAEERTEKDVDWEGSNSDAGHGAPAAASTQVSTSTSTSSGPTETLTIEALRLVELTGRTSSVMQSIETDSLVNTDDLLQLFKQYGTLRGFHVKPRASVAELDGFPHSVTDYAERAEVQLVVLPWTTPASGASGAVMDEQASIGVHLGGGQGAAAGGQEMSSGGGAPTSPNPFDRIFGPDTNASPFYSVFLRRVMSEAKRDTAIFVDRGFHAGDLIGGDAQIHAGGHHHHQRLFLPFFGGADDRLALGLVIQMCRQSNVCATVIRFDTTVRPVPETIASPPAAASGLHHKRTMSVDSRSGQFEKDVQEHQNAMMGGLQGSTTPNFGSIPYNTTDGVLQSTIADDLAWEHFINDARVATRDTDALSRITFTTVSTTIEPLATAISYATVAVEQSRGASIRPLLVIAGRNRRGPSSRYGKEIAKLLTKSHLPPSVGAEIRKTVGDLTTAFVTSGTQAAAASFLVVQAAKQDAKE
ncbi:hypothetical protein QFC22_000835 [Naganishia vaughanmartiniae]|uniref:Uncharacterized protein n=1 Tax=Naganishia vaughanmartiniae TaxID=1424756 RepID=A0ACC2XJA1_9TREE|nr:hypothetical protein QFC22_000835 [Naganishia vaughanmartiniae]